MTPALLAVVVLFVLLLLVAEQRESATGKWLTKPVASLAFCGLAWLSYDRADAWHLPMLAGFALCWLGDVLLIPKDKRIFLAGIGAFLLGHVGFAVGFVVRGVDPTWTAGTAAALVPFAAGVSWWLHPHLKSIMKVAVPAYILVICAMVALAAGTFARFDGATSVLLLVGAVMFWLSDLCVARNRFVQPGFVNRVVGLPLYYGAVTLMAVAGAA